MRRTRHSTSLAIRVLALSLSGALPLRAQTGAWQPAGLEGHSIRAIAVDRLFPSTLVVATPSQLLRTIDGGATWSSIGPALPNATELTGVWSTTTALFAATNGRRLYRSVDGGLSWVWESVLAFTAAESATWFATAPSGIGDAIWCAEFRVSPCAAKVTVGGPGGERSEVPGRIPRFLRVMPLGATFVPDSYRVYAGYAGGIWSADSEYQPLPGNVTSVVAGTSSRAYAVAWTPEGATVWRRATYGWAPAGAGLPPSVAALAVHPDAPETVLAATPLGAFESTDGGLTWRTAGLEQAAVQTLAFDPSDSQTLYAGTSDGLFVRRGAAVSECKVTPTVQCLGDGRFRVEAVFRAANGRQGRAPASRVTPDTASFWFFEPNNLELVVKVLDGTSVNGSHWVFTGALSTVEYAVTVTDTRSGATRHYVNPPGQLTSFADTTAFPESGPPSPPAEALRIEPAVGTAYLGAVEACSGEPAHLCLSGGRFRVEASWMTPDGRAGSGEAVSLTSDTGYFWFFDDANVELVVKVLDGRTVNGQFWVFSGALSNVAYTITVTDTTTGVVRTYENPQGRLASFADTSAF